MRKVYLLLLPMPLWLPAPAQAQPQGDEAQSHVTMESGFVEFNHGQIYYELAGTGEVVVFVHGNFGDRRYWDKQVAALTTAHRVLLYDVRGFGKSSIPVEGVPYSEHEDLAHLLAKLNIASAHIVGFSMGASIATNFVLAYPGRSKSLVSVGPWVRGDFTSEALEAAEEDFAGLESTFKERGAAATIDFAVTKTFLADTIRNPETESRLRDIMKDFTWWYFRKEDPVVQLEPAAAGRLDEILVPTLIITGEHDIPACLDFANLLDRNVLNSQKVSIADTGHFMMMEKPDAFNRALLDFFAGIR